jgi:energy-coupling factor transport system permease protein
VAGEQAGGRDVSGLRAAYLPRGLHPGAWWLWALGLATAASRTTNPLLLLLIVAVSGYVVAARRTSAPWGRSYAAFLRLGLVVVVLRVAFQVVFGATGAGTVLFHVPEIPLPAWASGVTIGGDFTSQDLLGALYDGLRLATLLVCVGAANSLASPSRLLRCVPAALYEVGVAVVVALTLAPQMVGDVARVRAARRLRGRPDAGLRGLAGVALPVLEGALDRSLDLAAAMDARGYGRTAGVPPSTRRLTAALVLTGLVGVCAGVYGLLDGGSPEVAGIAVLGLPLLVAGVAAAGVGLAVAGRRSSRSRYRPDPWVLPEWLVSASGVAAGAALVVAGALGVDLLGPYAPPAWPTLPLLPALGILLAVTPAWTAPVPRRPVEPRGHAAADPERTAVAR